MRMRVEHTSIRAADGATLAATVFSPAEKHNDRVIIINSAIGIRRRFYSKFASYLSDYGFVVLTYDYRGIGDSVSAAKNFRDTRMRHWGEYDIAGAIDWALDRKPAKIFVVGHSAGAQLLGLAHNNANVAALLGIAAPLPYPKLWPRTQRFYLRGLWYLFIPVLARTLGFFPGRLFGLGTHLPGGVTLEWAQWGRDPRYIRGKDAPDSARHFPNFTGLFRSYAFTDDIFATPRSVRALMELYDGAEHQLREVRPSDVGQRHIGHTGFFTEKFRDSLWKETADWLASVS